MIAETKYDYGFLDQAKEPHRTRYINFIESRQSRVLSFDVPTDDHHVQPRSLGGADVSENRIELSAREHMIAHMMLWRAVGGKMTNAFHFMVRGMSRMKRAWVHVPFSVYNAVIQSQREELSKDNHQTGKKRTDETKRLMSEKRTGKVFMTDGTTYRQATQDEALLLIDQGWRFGMGDKISKDRVSRVALAKANGTFKAHGGEPTRGRVGISLDGKKRYVHPDKIPKGAKPMPGPNKGLIPITRDGLSKRVKPELLEAFLTDGWTLGVAKRKNPVPISQREQARESMTGRVWVKKGGAQMRITPDLLEDALASGWERGRLSSDKLDASRKANLEKARRLKPDATEETRRRMSESHKRHSQENTILKEELLEKGRMTT